MDTPVIHPLVTRAQNERNPLLEGERVTFVWRGRRQPHLMGDFNNWNIESPVALTQAAPGLWLHSLHLPCDGYFEYSFLLDGKRALDPLNPRVTPNGMGETQNYFHMPDAAPTPLVKPQKGVPRGKVTRHVLESSHMLVGGKRKVILYAPPVPEPVPLLVVLDGREYHVRVRFTTMLDNLIAAGRIRPVALAMCENGGQARFMEYACSETTNGFLVRSLLPHAEQHLNLLDHRNRPGVHGILGASMGGLAALFAGLRAPHVFGQVLSQSGAFSAFGHDFVIFDLVKALPVPPMRVWMNVGRYETVLDGNRRMRDLLAARGYDFEYREYPAGHNYPAWRDEVWRGLEWAWPAT